MDNMRAVMRFSARGYNYHLPSNNTTMLVGLSSRPVYMLQS